MLNQENVKLGSYKIGYLLACIVMFNFKILVNRINNRNSILKIFLGN